MPTPQPGILAAVPAASRYLTFGLRPGADPTAALAAVRAVADGDACVAGFGPSLVAACGAAVPGLHPLEALAGARIDVPSTPAALWLWLRGSEPGALVHAERAVLRGLGAHFRLDDRTDAFRYLAGHDLTGFEDGTENPEGQAATDAAFAAGLGEGLDGGSYVAVQRWVHDFDVFDGFAPTDRDHLIGRRLGDNEELEDAPEAAHVKRTAQEDYDPPAFVVRRSMPWSDARGDGLVFVAFGHSLSAFERLLHKMTGLDDGVADNLFRFTRPVTGATFFCPPMREGKLDLRAVGA